MSCRRPVDLLLFAGLIGAALLLSPPSARAEEKKGSWEAGFLVGQTFYAKEQQLSDETQTGLRVGWYFRPAYELEFQYGRTGKATLQSNNSPLVDDSTVFFTTHPTFTSDVYQLRFLINPRNERRRLKPYALFGLGEIFYNSDPKLTKSELGYDHSSLFIFGGGIRQKLTGRMAFRAEFDVENSRAQTFYNSNLNVGLTWIFGAGRPADT